MHLAASAVSGVVHACEDRLGLRAAKRRAIELGWCDDGKDADILPREEGAVEIPSPDVTPAEMA